MTVQPGASCRHHRCRPVHPSLQVVVVQEEEEEEEEEGLFKADARRRKGGGGSFIDTRRMNVVR